MCNDYRLEVDPSTIARGFSELQIQIRFSEGVPNMEAREDIRIGDIAPIVRRAAPGEDELVQRRWSWPGPKGKPVFNFRSDNREFSTGRCLIVVDGFYEFTTPEDPDKKRKDKWLFTKADDPWFCIAGLWRASAEVGEAFTMLTTRPGPDVAPYHDRQVAVLDRRDWAAWLNPQISAKKILKPLPEGTLKVEQVG